MLTSPHVRFRQLPTARVLVARPATFPPSSHPLLSVSWAQTPVGRHVCPPGPPRAEAGDTTPFRPGTPSACAPSVTLHPAHVDQISPQAHSRRPSYSPLISLPRYKRCAFDSPRQVIMRPALSITLLKEVCHHSPEYHHRASVAP